MRTRIALLFLLVVALACRPKADAPPADTSAIQGAGSAPHPPPVTADSAAARAARDSAARRRP